MVTLSPKELNDLMVDDSTNCKKILHRSSRNDNVLFVCFSDED